MQTKHILILAGWIGSVAVMIGSLSDWHAATTPQFVGGLLGALATQVIGLYTERPNA